MTITSTPPLSLSNVRAEFGGSAPYSLRDYLGAGGAPSSPPLSLTDFYGRSGFTSWSRRATEQAPTGTLTFFSVGVNRSSRIANGNGTSSATVSIGNEITVTAVSPNTFLGVGYTTWPDVGGNGIPPGTYTVFYEWVGRSGNNFGSVNTTITAFSNAARTVGAQTILSRSVGAGVPELLNSDSVSITVPVGKPYLVISHITGTATNAGSELVFTDFTIS